MTETDEMKMCFDEMEKLNAKLEALREKRKVEEEKRLLRELTMEHNLNVLKTIKYAGYNQKYNKKEGYVCRCCNPDKVYKDRGSFSNHLKTAKHKRHQEQFDQRQKEIEIAVQTNIALAQLKMN